MGIFDGLFGTKKEEETTSTATATMPAPTTAANMNLTPAAEEFDVIEPDLLDMMARLKGRTTAAKAVKAAVSVIYPITGAISAEERRKEIARKKAEEAALKNPTPGRLMPDGTVYLGQYSPKDRAGKSLGKIFNVYAAPEDLPETMKYVDAVKHIAKLKKWHGYDGTNYPTDKEIYAALKDGSYNGGWIIPTRELLVGTEPDGESGVRKGKVIQPDNLFDHQNKGTFKGTFKTAASSGSDCPDWYWSSTEHRGNPSGVWAVRFSDGYEGWDRKDDGRLRCRPVRLVEVPGLLPAPRVRSSPRKRR